MTGTDQSAMRADANICGLLCRVFDCAEDLADQILLRGRLRRYGARVTIVNRGDRISTLYVVIDGRAHALVYSMEGQAVLLHEYRSGDMFGVMSSPYSATHDADVVAIEDVNAFLLDGVVLALLAEQHACIGLALLRFMVERLQQTASRMYEHAALSAVGRVHAELLRQAREGGDLTIRPSPVLAELALRVSTTRETASRAVNALERRGIIRRDGETLVVVAPHRLEELVI
ncbi:MAG: family transcriptional regulator, cyclic receptor protein [Sphingomonadales bacterium]|jgi:CRP-like cAMP-binding protein|nr:family transcriptional regulator, cyclic receptor protein [Sphingomonadales bacterium]MEA3043703.1 family transcriptional regulator, cyclic receptor protein [Sphingomonadales bacterium]